MHEEQLSEGRLCQGCGHRMAASRLTCPACQRLVHADRLKQISHNAAEMESGHDVVGALTRFSNLEPRTAVDRGGRHRHSLVFDRRRPPGAAAHRRHHLCLRKTTEYTVRRHGFVSIYRPAGLAGLDEYDSCAGLDTLS